ncbi:MAG: hypothetical protein ACR2NR_14370 [Solirubrobacteraceae bacterium]
MRSYSFTVTEHDPERPWIIVGSGRHAIELEDDVQFFVWAREQWPAARFTVQLDPWQL